MPPRVARHKVRDIRKTGRRNHTQTDTTVVDLSAYSGRNVIRLPSGPPSAA